jgi:hypothetical protein
MTKASATTDKFGATQRRMQKARHACLAMVDKWKLC